MSCYSKLFNVRVNTRQHGKQLRSTYATATSGALNRQYVVVWFGEKDPIRGTAASFGFEYLKQTVIRP